MHAGGLAAQHRADDLRNEVPELGNVHQEVLGDLKQAAEAAKEHVLRDHPLGEKLRHERAGLRTGLGSPLNNLRRKMCLQG